MHYLVHYILLFFLFSLFIFSILDKLISKLKKCEHSIKEKKIF
jgi:hypothetical protein